MTGPAPPSAAQLLALMKRRRVCRSFTAEPVAAEPLRMMAEAARWASSAGNRHLHKFLIVRDPTKIRRVRALSPGMLAPPPALIAILLDTGVAAQQSVQIERDRTRWTDVGTAAMNMMNLAEMLGLGSCPVTSFSRSGVAVVLDLPAHLVPEWLLMVGHPAPRARVLRPGAAKPITAHDLTYWEEAGRHEP